jgi:hypothetical protein
VSDTLVLVLTGLLAVGTLGVTVRTLWRTARHPPTRQRALSQVLAGLAGTALLGVVLPAVLLEAVDPVLVWLPFAVLAVATAAVLGWRWPALERGPGRHPGLAITSGLLLVVLAVAAVAVT